MRAALNHFPEAQFFSSAAYKNLIIGSLTCCLLADRKDREAPSGKVTEE